MEEYWINKEGKFIPVSEMSEEYAKNCLRLLLKRKRENALNDLEHEVKNLHTKSYWANFEG